MYVDHNPVPNHPSSHVLVLEQSDFPGIDSDEVIASCPTTVGGDGDSIFWIVFADKPKRVWDFTERSLRAEINQLSKTGTEDAS